MKTMNLTDARKAALRRDALFHVIQRNNGEILVIAPSVIITRDEAEGVVDLMDRAITAMIWEAAP